MHEALRATVRFMAHYDDVTETVPVQFRVGRDLKEQFEQVCAGEERTVSAALRHHMKQRVESEQPRKAEAPSAPPLEAS
jgi:hypothetical protein